MHPNYDILQLQLSGRREEGGGKREEISRRDCGPGVRVCVWWGVLSSMGFDVASEVLQQYQHQHGRYFVTYVIILDLTCAQSFAVTIDYRHVLTLWVSPYARHVV